MNTTKKASFQLNNVDLASKLATIYKVYSVLVIILSFLLIFYFFQNSEEQSLTSISVSEKKIKSNNNEVPASVSQSPTMFNRSTKTAKTCEGYWINTIPTGKVDLKVLSLDFWASTTPPIIIAETLDESNTVIIGHNICKNNNCFEPGSNFGKIINLKIGDKLEVCFRNSIYEGYVLTSSPISETNIEVLGNWTGFPAFTLFTSFGRCKDPRCDATDQRWLVVIEK